LGRFAIFYLQNKPVLSSNRLRKNHSFTYFRQNKPPKLFKLLKIMGLAKKTSFASGAAGTFSSIGGIIAEI